MSDEAATLPSSPSEIRWIVTTQDAAWQDMPAPEFGPITDMPNVILVADSPKQLIEGFGASFNELGWTSLAVLDQAQRDEIFRELFAPGDGAGFAVCRMPIGANDFSRDWYSYDEVAGDFALQHFSIENDLETLVPFIRAAKEHRPDLKIWASPWSPPSWMKTNGHYAGALPNPFMNNVENGLRPDQVGLEGTDMFILDEPHLAAYARYFGRFIDEYRALGIPIDMVMPQNEFNSPQVFPSCTWTPAGFAAFLRHLGPEMRSQPSTCSSEHSSAPMIACSGTCWRMPPWPTTCRDWACSGRASAPSPPCTACTPSCGSIRQSRNAATAAMIGGTRGTPGR
jgi:glucosylceramidase